MEKFITLTEAAKLLGIEEHEMAEIAEKGEITAYRIGGNFLRFKLKDIEDYKKKKYPPQEGVGYSWREKIYDFLYYYDFYLILILIIVILLIIIFKF
ncbi:MAG: helix-turn-helix domain-containing protein [Candidatus Omnitrophica bacterium]|nr:helix-turn-helix domain-containing protein [Candidatus Omnitrophota bacterium]MCM8793693.1 helix-turn-helix domain-containing protein [Candidatus Omnitrophota bacterium]